jgi:exonuclease VII small subunit
LTLRFTKTDAALERLEQAVARLEGAVAALPGGLSAPKAGKAPAALPDLFGHDELTRARQDYARLDQASRQVEGRLDAMADRLQTLLETGS